MKYISPWIFTTYRCNLACPYCYVKQKAKDMSIMTLLETLARMGYLLETKQVDFIVLRIAGGEPMLAWDIWKYPIQHFLKKYPEQSSVGLISNLTILTNKQISYLKKNKFGYGISLDGWSFSKEYKNGVTSGKRVRINVDRLNQYNKTDISTVITSKSIDDIEKLAGWVADRNMNWGIYLDHYYDGDFDIKYLSSKLFEVLDVLFEKGYDVLNKFKFNNVKLSSMYDGCTAGQNLMAVDVEGNVHDCQTAIYGTPTCYINDFTPRKTVKHLTPIQCAGCPIKVYCRGGCKLNNNFGDTCNLMLLINAYILNKLEI